MQPFELTGADGKLIRGDRAEDKNRRILFMTGFLSKRWGNMSKALAQWCREKGWRFRCYDQCVIGDSKDEFTVHIPSGRIADGHPDP